MNRWKREEVTPLRVMHAHNQPSEWHYAVLQAAEELGLLVGYSRYPNGSGDGSTDELWYVCGPQLDRLGGVRVLHERADALHERSTVRVG